MNSFFSRHALKLLLSLALFTGAVVYRDFGIGWDESFSVTTGLINYNYVFEGDSLLKNAALKDYGAAFELPATIAVKALGLEDSRDIYLLRRILTYLLFVVACCCIFLLADSLYNDKLAASAAFLMLWLHPQIFAHSFFNSKDMPFLSFLAITLYLLLTAIQKKEWWLFCLAGTSAGLLTGTRIPGVIYIALGAGWIFSESLFSRRPGYGLLWSALFCVCSMISLYISWPNLWSSPVNNFLEAFTNMSKYPWDSFVLYMDVNIAANQLPWHYIPVWFIITMPLLFLVPGICGILIPFWSAITKRRVDSQVRTGFFLVLCLVLPVVAVITMKSVLYDGWRHLYFIYVPFVLLSAGAMQKLSALNKRTAAAAVAVLLLPVCAFHIYAHPFQFVHFNALTKHKYDDLRYEYEMDYWGNGYKQGLEFILAHDTASLIPVSGHNLPLELNINFLPPADRKRFRIVSIPRARYFLTNYRFHRGDYSDLPVKAELLKSFRVSGNTVHDVFRMSNPVNVP